MDDSGLRQTKPAFIACPPNRSSFPDAMRNTGQGLPPPDGLTNYPRPPSLIRVAELRNNTPCNDPNCEGQRTSDQSAPELVACVAMMNPNLISRMPGIMVPDRNDGRETDIVTRRHTLQAVIRFFIHVVKARFKPG